MPVSPQASLQSIPTLQSIHWGVGTGEHSPLGQELSIQSLFSFLHLGLTETCREAWGLVGKGLAEAVVMGLGTLPVG